MNGDGMFVCMLTASNHVQEEVAAATSGSDIVDVGEAEVSIELQLVRVRCELLVLEATTSAPLPLELVTSGGKKATAKHADALQKKRDRLQALLLVGSAARANVTSPAFRRLVVQLCHLEVRFAYDALARIMTDNS